MKLNIAVGRKADKFKVLYVGGDADKALEAMTEAAKADKPKFEVRTNEGVFLGYTITTEGWKKEYLVLDLRVLDK